MQIHNALNWMIVTDLDGTLLDHHTYRFKPALSTLLKLEGHNIPVIINSSKTEKEIDSLRKELHNKHPFIIENGSGILIPQTYFSRQPKKSQTYGSYWEINLGKSREELIHSLNKLPDKTKNLYRSFHQSNIDEIIEMTGLTKEKAVQSMQRRYTEPIQWQGNDEQREQFYTNIKQQGLALTEGGRFIHIMGHTNKGRATTWLKKYYEEEFKKPINVIALGDGNNDIDMLKAADIAVIVKSPVHPPPQFNHPHKIITTATGPNGWHEAIHHLIFEKNNIQQQ